MSVESERWGALGSSLSQPRRGASPEAAGPAPWTFAFCVSFTWALKQCKHQCLQEFSNPVFSMWCSFHTETLMGNTACGAQTTWPRNSATAISSVSRRRGTCGCDSVGARESCVERWEHSRVPRGPDPAKFSSVVSLFSLIQENTG